MIYCVEDDSSIRNLMLYALTASGFEAQGFENSEAFYEALEKKLPELVMLDIMLPGEDGLSILKRLKNRADTAALPVILSTAKGTEFDKVTGLDLGADDYLAKPFGMMEMVSRIRAVLRRTQPRQKEKLQLGLISMDLERHSVTSHGEPLSLTLKEYDMLRLFLENPGKAFTRDQLLSAIWDTDYLGETRTVDVHVGTLRTKLGNCGVRIRTVRGVGYRLEADL